LAWVAERADLVELSAVLLGADPGSQLMRRDVEAAVERVRSAGHRVPLIEQLLRDRGRVSFTSTRDGPDITSAAPLLQDLAAAFGALRSWLNIAGPIRHQIADDITGV